MDPLDAVIGPLKEQLVRDEGNHLKPYRDTSKQIGFEGRPGKLTIGVGRNLDDVGIFHDESDLMLGNDVARALNALAHSLPWFGNLDSARLGVLVNMTFNEGIAGLLGFRKMLGALEIRDYVTAAQEMEDSLWYQQVGARAARLVKQMQSGAWQ